MNKIEQDKLYFKTNDSSYDLLANKHIIAKLISRKLFQK